MPPIHHLLETAIYATDLDRAEAFYRDVMGLELMGKSDRPNRGMWFKVGEGILLVFNPDETLKGDMLPAHGTRGPGHFAFAIQRDALDVWRSHLQRHGVGIEKEV